MKYSVENTTHKEAIKLLNEFQTNQYELVFTLIKGEARVGILLYDLWQSAIQGEIAQNLSCNPFSIPAVKAADKFFSDMKELDNLDN